jgi:hypothetical protein
MRIEVSVIGAVGRVRGSRAVFRYRMEAAREDARLLMIKKIAPTSGA